MRYHTYDPRKRAEHIAAHVKKTTPKGQRKDIFPRMVARLTQELAACRPVIHR